MAEMSDDVIPEQGAPVVGPCKLFGAGLTPGSADYMQTGTFYQRNYSEFDVHSPLAAIHRKGLLNTASRTHNVCRTIDTKQLSRSHKYYHCSWQLQFPPPSHALNEDIHEVSRVPYHWSRWIVTPIGT